MEDRNAIGARLRAIRKECGVTGHDLAHLLGCNQSRISKIETGRLKPTREFARDFGVALGLSKSEVAELVTLTEMFLVDFDRWRLLAEGSLPDLQGKVEQLEVRTHFLRTFQWFAIPGLLQTRRYAHGMFRLLRPISSEEVDGAITKRLRRQAGLRRKRKRFSFVIAENALRVRVCSKEAMRDQLTRVWEASQLPNVTIRILPTATPLPVIPVTSFDVFDERLVMVETKSAPVMIWGEDDINRYINDFRSLEDCATRSERDFQRILDDASRWLNRLND